jgi:phosphoglycolate phosphatase
VNAAARRPPASAWQPHGPTPIRAILFDKDGTLFDFRKTWLAAYRGAAAELAEVAGLGPGFVDALLSRHGYDPASDTFAAESPLLWATTHDQAALWSAEPELAAIGDVEPRLERHFSDLDAYPPVPVTDLVSLFERLRTRGLKLGIATMDATAATEATLVRIAARDLIDFLACCDGGHGIKPDPGMVLGFCAAVGVAPREVAVVGDNLADLAMARAAGAGLAIAVLTGGCPAAALAAEADLVLPSIAGLESALAERFT